MNLLSVPVCYQNDCNTLIIRLSNSIDCIVPKVLNALLALRRTPTVKSVAFYRCEDLLVQALKTMGSSEKTFQIGQYYLRLSLANCPHDYSGESEPVFSGIITHKYCGINIWQLYEELRQWMIEQHKSVTPTSPIGKALDYSMKGWKELSVYTSDSRLEIDNNKIENEIRPIAMGGKNYCLPV